MKMTQEQQIKRKEVLEVMQELYDKGTVVKKLDDEGRPMLDPSPLTGELQQVYKLHDFATLEERVFWCNEHPGTDPADWQRVWLQ